MFGRSLPLISVIIPLYNKSAHIGRCLGSVRSQTFTDYEIIIVDDGSTDDGAEIASAYLRDGDRLIQQENEGAAAARNRGIAAMRGKLAAFLDADDEWLPLHLACLVDMERRFPEAGLFSTGIALHGLGGFAICCGIDSPEPQLIPDYFDVCLNEPNPVNSSSCAIRREVFEAIGGQALGALRGEDLEFFARISLHWPLALHPAINAVIHLIAENRSEKVNKRVKGFPVTVDTLTEHLREGDVPRELVGSVRQYLRYCMMASLRNAMLSRDVACTQEGLASPLIQEFGLTRQANWMKLKMHLLPLPLILLMHRIKSLRWFIMPYYVNHGMRVSLQRVGTEPSHAQWAAAARQHLRINPIRGTEAHDEFHLSEKAER